MSLNSSRLYLLNLLNLKKKAKKGQMMIEILLALSIVVLVLVALMSAAVVSLGNTTFAKNTVLANHYAQEGIERARKERDQADDWDQFTTDYNEDKCLDEDLNWSNCDCEEVNPTANIGIFYRCLNLDNSEADKTIVTATVFWAESGRDHQSQAATVLTKWER